MILFVLGALALAVVVVLFFPAPRRAPLSGHLMNRIARVLPKLGKTERIALEAGAVWWDGELFSGNPDWRLLLDFQPCSLTEHELARKAAIEVDAFDRDKYRMLH